MKKKKIIIIITIISFIVVMASIGSIVAIKRHTIRTVKQAAKEEKVIKKTTIEVQKEEVVKDEPKKGEESFDYEFNIGRIYNIYFSNKYSEEIKTTGEVNYDLERIKDILKKNGVTLKFGCKDTLLDIYDSMTDIHRALIAFNNIDVSNQDMKRCTELFEGYEVDKIHYGTPTYVLKTGVCPITHQVIAIPYDRVNTEYRSLYGKDLPKETIDGSKASALDRKAYEYIPAKNIYTELQKNHSGCKRTYFIFIIKSVKEENNKINVEMYYTKSKEANQNGTGESITFDNFKIEYTYKENLNIYQEIIDKYLDKVDIYDIEFTIKNGRYVLNNIKTKEA